MKRLVFYHSAAVLVLGGLMAGCSNDVDYVSIVDQKLEAYEQVFKSEFGKIDPTHTWGFMLGEQQASQARSLSMTRALQSSFTFPGDAAASNFLSAVPAGVAKGGDHASGETYIDETYTGAVNIWGAWDGSKTSGGKLYIKGNCDFSNRKFYVAPNTEVYLIAGATLTLNSENAANLQENDNYYIAPNAKIVTSSELVLNKGLHMYNHGTIEAGKLSTNNNSVLYNSNKVKVTTSISVENELSVIVNDGEITAATLYTAGSGKVQNNGDVVISGSTTINSNQNTWVNNGTYRTQYFNYTAGSSDVINNCFLTVDEDFNINLGDNPGTSSFQMDAGAGVLTKNFNGGGSFTANGSTHTGGPFHIYMGAGSVFKVTNTATMNATKADYGIYGVGSDFSVFQAKDIVAGAANQGYEVTYGGKLAVVAETHFAQGYSGTYPYIDFKDGCSEGNIYANGFMPDIHVKPSTCNPGFNYVSDITLPVDQSVTTGSSQTQVTTIQQWVRKELIEQGRVFCEDLGQVSSSDLDFNDVVFDAYIYKNTYYTRTIVTIDGVEQPDLTTTVETKTDNTANIVLLAAGGTLPLSVAGVEVHNALAGVGTGVIINTVEDNDGAYGNQWVNCEPKELEGDFAYSSINDIEINVIYGNGSLLQLMTEQGQAPHKICVPIGTKWAKERVLLRDAYTTFADYVGNASIQFWTSGMAGNLFSLEKKTYSPRSTVPFERMLSEETTTTVIGTGTTTTGGYQGGEVLSRRMR